MTGSRQFAVTTVCPAGNRHCGAFAEVSDSLHYGLLQLGHRSQQAVNALFSDATNLVIGAHLLGADEGLPEDAILVNLEQLQGNASLPAHYLERLQRHTVWDYSAANIRELCARGARQPLHVPLGYVPELERIRHGTPDTDVLFYGSLNPRRTAVLDRLSAAGARVEKLFGVYGAERDACIARARIVLNMHFYEANVLEVVRIVYLLANRIFVVSEHGADAAETARFEGALAFCAYEHLADTCLRYLAEAQSRESIAAAGQQRMRALPQAAYLRPAVEKLFPA